MPGDELTCRLAQLLVPVRLLCVQLIHKGLNSQRGLLHDGLQDTTDDVVQDHRAAG